MYMYCWQATNGKQMSIKNMCAWMLGHAARIPTTFLPNLRPNLDECSDPLSVLSDHVQTVLLDVLPHKPSMLKRL
jgi:hypothetical protein